MKLFYKASTNEGKILTGLIEARDSKGAGLFLRKQGLFPISITEKKKEGLLAYLPFLGKSTLSDLIFFTRQLASMLTAGLTLMQAMRILKTQIEKPEMADTVSAIIVDIEDGKPFSSSLAKFPHIFSPIYVSLIQAAETAGLLDKVLIRLADNLEKQAHLRSTIQGALIYPAIVLIGMVGAVVVMMVVVVPQLAGLYKSLNVSLPLSTRIIIWLSDVTVLFWPFIVSFWLLFFPLLHRWRKTKAGQLVLDNLLLRFPIFGKLTKQFILTELTRTFGLLVGSGVLVVEALEKAGMAASNIYYKQAMEMVAQRVEKGVSVGDAMSASALFPPIVPEMVKIGESTGKLDEQLLRVSEYFEREVDQTVKNLTTIIDPLLIIILGVGVGFLLISIITPIYGLLSSFR